MVIWVWEIAGEETQKGGRLSRTPLPEAHEPRVGLAVQLAIFNRGCEPEGVFIELTIHLKNAPSSEPDAGERHVPYAVFKPIKDGINGYVRGVTDIFGDSALYFGSSNSKSGDSGSSDITSKIQAAWDFLQIWIILLTIVFVILEAVEVITYPFTSIGAVGVSTLVDFCKPIILGLVAGAIFSGVFAIIEDTKDGSIWRIK